MAWRKNFTKYCQGIFSKNFDFRNQSKNRVQGCNEKYEVGKNMIQKYGLLQNEDVKAVWTHESIPKTSGLIVARHMTMNFHSKSKF